MCVSDHLDDNVGQLLEAYIQNKTTPSSYEWIVEKIRESAFGYFLGDVSITSDQLCKFCPIIFEFLALERRQGMTNIQLSGEVAYFCSILDVEKSLDVCLGVIEANVVS